MEWKAIEACPLPQLHWFSAMVLDYYLSGLMPTSEFLRWFHMPNSDYLALGQCVVQQFDPGYRPGMDLNGTLLPDGTVLPKIGD